MPIKVLFGIVREVLSDWQVWIGGLVFLSSAILIGKVTKFDKKPKVRVRLPEETVLSSGGTEPAPPKGEV
ncbi:MAG: hypothetical protein N2442_13930 [Spirochaetes bacterium]|nr:hypothetical protein [Spirochaetota bacterium]